MRAVRIHGVGDLKVEDVPAPIAPGAGEVRLRVRAATVRDADDIAIVHVTSWRETYPGIVPRLVCQFYAALGGRLVAVSSNVLGGAVIDAVAYGRDDLSSLARRR